MRLKGEVLFFEIICDIMFDYKEDFTTDTDSRAYMKFIDINEIQSLLLLTNVT